MVGAPEERVVFDISSDEEVVGEGEGEDGGGGDSTWITDLLEVGDGGTSENSDDVIVVKEVILKTPKRKFNSDDDDDDCVVLEEDPDKPVQVHNNGNGGAADDDSDDLLVVSEKGQIACRDYPHARHLCAKFPFASTPHERHCDQCHCYVCDTLAPCAHWGSGSSSVAHCQATDKEKYWKAQRQSTKKSDKAHPFVPTGPDTSVSGHPRAANQVPGQTQRLPNYLPQHQNFRQAPIRPCSISSSPGLPNVTGQQYTALRDKFHSHAQQLRNASINVIPRDKTHHVGPLGPQLVTTRTTFKSAGSSEQASAMGRSAYNSANTTSVPQFVGTHSSVTRWPRPCARVPVGSNKYIASSQPNAGMRDANVVSCQSQLHRQPGLVRVPANYTPMVPEMPSQPNTTGIHGNVVSCQSQLHRQPGLVRVPVSYTPIVPQMSSQPNAGPNTVSSQHQVPTQPTLVGLSANYTPMGPAIPSQLNAAGRGASGVSFRPQLPMQPSLAGVSANYAPTNPVMLSQPSADMLGANVVPFQPQLARQPGHVDASADYYAPVGPQIPSQPQVSVCANSASLEVPAFSMPCANSSSSQPHLSTIPSILDDFENFLSSENAVSSQAQVNNCNDPLVSEAQMFSQQTSVSYNQESGNTSVNTLGTQYPLAWPTNASTTCGNSTASVSQMSNQPDGGFKPELLRQHLSSSNSQNVSQQGYQNENALGSSFEDFGHSWETQVSQGNSLGHVNNAKPNESPVVSRPSQLVDNPTNLDIQCDDWLVSGPFNILSPEIPPIASGFFDDF